MPRLPPEVILAVVFGVLGSVIPLLYALGRFGSVEHGWVKLDKDQTRWLEENHGQRGEPTPQAETYGEVLYSRRLASHDGLRVHKNGLYAKFALGRKARYRFVPFTEITGVFPVRFDNPFAAQGPAWFMGPSQWQGLQIETESYLVLVVSSLKHDLGQIQGLLRKGVDRRWEKLWHPEIELRTNFHEGDVYIHAALRSALPPRLVPPSFTTAFSKRSSQRHDKGALLIEEDAPSLNIRRTRLLLRAALLLVAGVGVLAIAGLGLQGFLPRSLVLAASTGLLLGPFLLVLAALHLHARSRMVLCRVYENGVDAESLLGTVAFVSWGEVLTTRPQSALLGGETIFFRATRDGSFTMPRRLPGLDDLIETVRPRFGRPEYVTEIPPDEAQITRGRRVELGMYGVALAVSLALPAFQLPVFPVQFQFLALVMSFAVLGVFTITFWAYRLGSIRIGPQRIRVKIPAVAVSLLLVMFLSAVWTGGGLPSIEGDTTVGILEPRPGSTSLTAGTYSNLTLTAEGTVRVDSGETLWLLNSTLVLNLTATRAFGVWIGPGGRLVLEDTTVRSADPRYRFWFEILGSAAIRNSTIRDLWGDPELEHVDGGLEIHSSDVRIEGSLIMATTLSGILVMNADPWIANTTVQNAGDVGIDLQNSDAYLYNVTVKGCPWAMVFMFGASAVVESSRFMDNGHGLYVSNSNPTVRNSTFERNGEYAILFNGKGGPTLSGNTFLAGGHEILDETFPLGEVCTSTVLFLGVVCLIVLYRIHRKQRLKAARPNLS